MVSPIASGLRNLAAAERERDRKRAEDQDEESRRRARALGGNGDRDEAIENMRDRLQKKDQLITRAEFEIKGRSQPRAHGNMIHRRNEKRENHNRDMHQHDAHPELLQLPRKSGIDMLNKIAQEKHEQLLGRAGAAAKDGGGDGPSKAKLIAHNTVQAALALEWKGEIDEVTKKLELHRERMAVYKQLMMQESEEGGGSVDLLAQSAGLVKRTFSHWFRAVLVQVEQRLGGEHRRLLTIVRLNTVHEDDQAPGVNGRDVCLRTIFEWWSLIVKCRLTKPSRFRTLRATFVSTGIHAMLGIPQLQAEAAAQREDRMLQLRAQMITSAFGDIDDDVSALDDAATAALLAGCDSETTLESFPSLGDSSASTFHGIHPKDWKPAGSRPLSRMRGLNAMLNDAHPPNFLPLAGSRQTLSRLQKRRKHAPTLALPGLPELSLEQTQRKLDHWHETCEIHKVLARKRTKKRNGSRLGAKGPVYLAKIASRTALAMPPSTKSLSPSALDSPRYKSGAASLRYDDAPRRHRERELTNQNSPRAPPRRF